MWLHGIQVFKRGGVNEGELVCEGISGVSGTIHREGHVVSVDFPWFDEAPINHPVFRYLLVSSDAFKRVIDLLLQNSPGEHIDQIG